MNSQPLDFIAFAAELSEFVYPLVLYDRRVHIEANAVSRTEQLLDGLLRWHNANWNQRQCLQGGVLEVAFQTVNKQTLIVFIYISHLLNPQVSSCLRHYSSESFTYLMRKTESSNPNKHRKCNKNGTRIVSRLNGIITNIKILRCVIEAIGLNKYVSSVILIVIIPKK